MTYTTRPLSDRTWLRPATQRKRSQFDSAWWSTLELLEKEVEFLRGKRLVIEVDVREQDIKLNGELRAHARTPEHPAVVVAFESAKHGPMLYRCDRFEKSSHRDSIGWQENVRAIALTLQAARAMDRYGATDTGQQYVGFKALPAGREAAIGLPPSMTEREAATLLERIVIGDEGAARQRSIERIMTDPLTCRDVIKRARRETHPDVRGDEAMWREVDQAARALASVAEATR